MHKIAQDIIAAITTKQLSKEAEKFITHWLSDEDKTSEDRMILDQLARSNAKPYNGGNLFRGCKELMDDTAESYTISINVAGRFAGNDGYVIAIDSERFIFDTFDLSNFVCDLIGDIITGEEENDGRFSEEFLNAYDERSGEDEVFVVTALDCSIVMKTHAIGSEI